MNNSNIKRVLQQIKQGKMNAEEAFSYIKEIKETNPANEVQNEESSMLYFEKEWKSVGANKGENYFNRDLLGGNYLVFDNDTVIIRHLQHLVEETGAEGASFILVRPGSTFKKVENNVYELNPIHEEGYSQLIDNLYENGIIPDKIIHMWSKDSFTPDKNVLERQLYEGGLSVLFLSKALKSLSNTKKGSFIYAYQAQTLNPHYAAVKGLINVLGLENPMYVYRSIEFETPLLGSEQGLTHSNMAERILLESQNLNNEDRHIRYDGDQRKVLLLKEFDPNKESKRNLPLKEKGVYLITGGTGKLGIILSRYLANRGTPKLLLVGRSGLTESKKDEIQQLKELGAEVEYIKADISDKQDVENLYSKVKYKYQKINGIFHVAGLIRDSQLINKTTIELQEVLSPKIDGTVLLDEIFGEEDLDFFVMFSSISAIIGTVGQADYAFANSFLDHYSLYREELRRVDRRHGQTISINWPLWKEGGMGINDETEKMLNRTTGFTPLETNLGIQALDQGLRLNKSGVILLNGDKSRIEHFVGGKIKRDEQNKIKSAAQKKQLFDRLHKDLISFVTEILKATEEEIDIELEMSRYGFESITLTEFSNKINDEYGLQIMPSIFFEYPSLKSFMKFLCAEHEDDLYKYYKLETEIVETQMVEPSKNSYEKTVNTSAKQELLEEASMDLQRGTSTPRNEDIAIIGLGGVMPGSKNLDEFWESISNGDSLIGEVPPDRWDWQSYYGAPESQGNRTNVKWGGFMKEIDKFDARFFGISPKEAELMNPQQRIFLETVWQTVENAGYNVSHLSGTTTGLFVGVAGTDYNDVLIDHEVDIEAYSSTGLAHSMVANRISYLLDIHGPSESVDTACSSSLVAIHRAVQSIRNGECEAAIAGGINVMIHPSLHIAFNKAGMLAEDGKCKTFDKDANGYVRGEGSGAVYLKPLSKALADGDYIHGLIKGSAVNHGGHANSLTAPNPNAQASLIIRAHEEAGVNPSSISYIEAHGTGTSLGDPVEINGLKKAFSTLYEKWGLTPPLEPNCGIGSVKTNIGHLETAAGIAGVIKVLFAMKNNKLPALLNFNESNPYIKLEGSPFYFVDKTVDWKKGTVDMPRRAGVSSFGFGGTNAHVIIEDYPQDQLADMNEEINPQIFVLSAKNEETLKVYVENLKDHLIQNQNISLKNLSYTLQYGRKAYEERFACVVTSVEELIVKLNQYIQDKNAGEGIFYGNVKKNKQNGHLMFEGDAGEVFIRSLISSKDVQKIVELWIAGYAIDWKMLHMGENVKRIPLPTYPFAREKHWFESKRKNNHLERKININNNDEYQDVLNNDINEVTRPIFLKQVWETSEGRVGSVTASMDDLESIMVLVQDDRVFYEFKSAVERKFQHNIKFVIRVKWGLVFADLGDGTYEINPNKETDYLLLKDSIQKKGQDVSSIIHLWSIHDNPYSVLEKTLQLGVNSVLKGVQMLLDQNPYEKKKFIFAVTGKSEEILPQYAAVSSMLKTINLENPNFIGRYLIVDDEKLLSQTILLELNGDEGFEEVRYIKERREVLRVKENQIASKESVVDSLRNHGVYIVTGGAGGLGRVFSEYLANQYNARLVLIGRSAINTNKIQLMQRLEGLGAKAIYIQADVSNQNEVKRVVEETKSKFGSINGIFHCAGITKDGYFIRKTQEDLEEVMAPKVQGTLYLDELTRNEPLDLFVMFSSLTAIIGNVGQSDYAYANSYMNHFARNRNQLVKAGQRFGRTLSISWPLWSDGGMQISAEDRKILQNEIGIDAMPTDEGIKAWNIALSSDEAAFPFIYGNRKVINSLLVKEDNEILKSEPQTIMFEERQLQQAAESFIKEIFVELLKIPVNQLDVDSPFEEYGIDSIAIKQFNFVVEQKIGKLPKTLLFELRTIKELVSYMVNHHESELINHLRKTEFHKSIEIIKEPASPNNLELFIDNKPQKENKADRSVNKNYLKEVINEDTDEIAIIGVAGKYPGAKNLTEFWANLAEGKHSITEIPMERWDYKQYYNPDPDKSREGKMYTKWGGFIEDVDKFDTRFFGISPREAELMDPQERMFLETTWEALEDAGYTRKQLKELMERDNSADIGVFVGATTFSYSLLGAEEWVKGNLVTPNSEPWSIANRVSYLFNFSGPSVPVDTACSSSLTAIHMACESIKKGECSAAVVGGVNLYLHPSKFVGMSQMRMLSPTGRCHSFGDKGDGFVPGEGVGAVFLKPLKDAIRDKDNIYAVIKGSAVNHGGKTNGYTVPNPISQASLIKEALDNANFDPRTVSYIEAHGTGTILGDPIEVAGLTKAFQSYTNEKQYCSIGSAKSNIGHLESAAGIAGLTKILLQMKHGQLVPTLNAEQPNPNIDFGDSPFYLQHRLEAWKKPEVITEDGECKVYPRRAGISSFGAGGANAHIILEEYDGKTRTQADDGNEHIIVLSAKNSERLKEYAERLFLFLQHNEGNMQDIQLVKKWKENIFEQVVAEIAATVQVDKDEIGLDEALSSYGFDHLKLAELINRINTNLSLEVGISDVPMHSTVESLTNMLCTDFRTMEREVHKSQSEESPGDVSLEEIAFVLQTGREAMDERMAMAVSSKAELKEKLEQFISKDLPPSGVYKSNVKDNKWNTNQLFKGEEGNAFTQLVIQNGNLSKLCQLWVMGTEIDWELLYTHGKPYKVSLPTYPFEKERYWIPVLNDFSIDKGKKDVESLHPLLDRNVSTLQEQCFQKVLTKKDWYLKDHVIQHESLLPGVAYLEMAREAGELSGIDTKVNGIRNIVWSRPLAMKEETQEVRVKLYPEGDNIGYEVYSGVQDNKETHSQGYLFYNDKMNHHSESRIPIQEIKRRLKHSRNGKEYYLEFAEAGLSYGPSFQTIGRMGFNSSEVLAELKLPDHLRENRNNFILHPSLMDGAFQSVIGLAENGIEKQTYIPFSVGEILIYDNLREDCYVYITIPVGKRKIDSGSLAFDVKITDKEGRVLVSISDFVVRVLRDVHETSKKIDSPIYFSSEWKKSPLQGLETNTSVLGNVLVFDTDQEMARAAAKNINGSSVSVITVLPGTEFIAYDEGYQINPERPLDYELMFLDLKEKNKLPNSIIHLWSKDPYISDSIKIENQLEKSVYSLFNLCKEIEKYKYLDTIQIVYAYPSSVQAPQPHYAAVSGFLGSLSLEHSRYICKVVEFERTNDYSSEKWVSVLINELLESGDRMEVRYQDGERHVKVFEEFDMNLKAIDSNFPNIQDHKVYLLTGGLGGLGLIFARYLANKAKVKLALTDLTGLTDIKKEKIRELQKLGVQVIYRQCDLTDQEDTIELINYVKSKFGQLDGIIHGAGVIRDSLFSKKQREEMELVLNPKIYGTVNLDQATKDEVLDFFVMFSSLAAFGNLGQSDYAYANNFLVQYAHFRNRLEEEGMRSGRSLAINWPLWKKGGMKTDKETERYFETMGMKLMETETGLITFEKGLQTNFEQILVVEGTGQKPRKKVEQLLSIKSPKAGNVITNKQKLNDNTLIEKIRNELIGIICNILKIKEEHVDIDSNISEYGFDSISVTEFTNKVNEKYNISVTPAVFFEHPYIKSYADFLLHEYESNFVSYYETLLGGISEESEQEEIRFIHEDVVPEVNKPINSRFSEKGEKSFLEKINVSPTVNEPIAIIGIGGVMPQSDDLYQFWRNLVGKEDLITQVPLDRWDWKKYFGDPVNEGNKTNVTKAGFMKKIDEFDALFFNISPREASMMDPVQRIFLETAWKTFEDAGYKASDLSGTNTGLFVGVVSMEYYELIKDSGISFDPHMSTGNSRSILANRISYLLNLKGPSESIDTACSSSLVAIHRAVENIRMGKCDMALVGGVNVILSPAVHIAYSKAGMLSPDGRSKTFDKDANGYGRGEGSGAILIKPLSKALRDGDHIYGLIKGTAENHGGHVNTLTAPNPNAQADVIVAAYEDAGIDPSTVSYIEAHGTGTNLGDPIEVNGLKKAFKRLHENYGRTMAQEAYCGLGSVKTNIGHLEGAAGIAGLLKIILAMKNKVLPANRNLNELSPYVEIESTPFYVVNENKKWESIRDDKGETVPRRASVSSFGFGGVNAHVVLEEFENQKLELKGTQQPQVFVLSAKTEERLKAYASIWAEFLKNCQNQNETIDCEGFFIKDLSVAFEDIAVNLQEGRSEMDERLAFVADGPTKLIQLLEQYIVGENLSNVYTGNVKRSKQKSLLKDEDVETALECKDLERLAALWVAGAKVNWKYLHEGRVYRRLSLPTYPFSREKHWIKNPENPKIPDVQPSITDQEKLPNLEKKNIEILEHRAGLLEVVESLQPYMIQNEAFDSFQMAATKLEDQLHVLLLNVFKDMGAFTSELESYTSESLKIKLGITARYSRLYNSLLGILKKAGYVTLQGGDIFPTIKVEQDTSQQKLQEVNSNLARLISDHPEIQYHVQLAKVCIDHLSDILRGDKTATEVIFPDSSMELVEKMYKDNVSSDYYNRLVVCSIEHYIIKILENDPNAQINILEIGAGTGGTSKHVLEQINKYANNLKYVYTDISKAFLLHGRREYGKSYPFLDFKQLNIEHDIEEQGFNSQEFDIIIASNVLHATRQLGVTLSNTKKLLKSGGWLLLNEVTEAQSFLTLTFGLLEGWWLYEDEQERLEGAPLLSSNMWESQMIRKGFEYAVGCCLAKTGNSIIKQDVIIGQNVNVSKSELEINEIGIVEDEPVGSVETDSKTMGEKEIESRITDCLSHILQIESSIIDSDIPYTDYGVDSLLAVECVNTINASLGINLRTTDLFNFATIKNLSNHILEKFGHLIIQESENTDEQDHFIMELLKKIEDGNLDIEEAKRMMEVAHGN